MMCLHTKSEAPNSTLHLLQGLRCSVPADNPGNIHLHSRTGKNLLNKKGMGFISLYNNVWRNFEILN